MARNCAASAGDTQCASAGSARELNRENWGKTLAAAVNWRSLTGAAQAKGHHARMNDFKHLFRQLPAIGAVCGERRQRNLLDRLPDLSKRVVDDGVSVGRFQARRSGGHFNFRVLEERESNVKSGTVKLEIEPSWT